MEIRKKYIIKNGFYYEIFFLRFLIIFVSNLFFFNLSIINKLFFIVQNNYTDKGEKEKQTFVRRAVE